MTTHDHLEDIVGSLRNKYKIRRYDLAHGYCDVFAAEVKRQIPNSVIFESEFGNQIDGHYFVRIDGRFYDAQDTAGVTSIDQLKYVRDFHGGVAAVRKCMRAGELDMTPVDIERWKGFGTVKPSFHRSYFVNGKPLQ